MSKIMIVDDNVDIIETLKTIMEMEGHVTEIAYNGEEFLKKVRKIRPDLVFLDVMMPGMKTKDILITLEARAESVGSEEDAKIWIAHAMPPDQKYYIRSQPLLPPEEAVLARDIKRLDASSSLMVGEDQWVTAQEGAESQMSVDNDPDALMAPCRFINLFMQADNIFDCLPFSLAPVTGTSRRGWEGFFASLGLPGEIAYCIEKMGRGRRPMGSVFIRCGLFWYLRPALERLMKRGYKVRQGNDAIIIFGPECKYGYVEIRKSADRFDNYEVYHSDSVQLGPSDLAEKFKIFETLSPLPPASLSPLAVIGAGKVENNVRQDADAGKDDIAAPAGQDGAVSGKVEASASTPQRIKQVLGAVEYKNPLFRNDELDLRHVILTLTVYCNRQCPFCCANDVLLLKKGRKKDPSKTISRATLDEFLVFCKKNHKKIEDCCVTGGEPFLEFDKLLYLISKIEVAVVSIITNGLWAKNGKDRNKCFEQITKASDSNPHLRSVIIQVSVDDDQHRNTDIGIKIARTYLICKNNRQATIVGDKVRLYINCAAGIDFKRYYRRFWDLLERKEGIEYGNMAQSRDAAFLAMCAGDPDISVGWFPHATVPIGKGYLFFDEMKLAWMKLYDFLKPLADTLQIPLKGMPGCRDPFVSLRSFRPGVLYLKLARMPRAKHSTPINMIA